MKLYQVKSSAHRAAKQAGLTPEQYEVVEVEGQFGYKVIEAPKAEVTKEKAAPAMSMCERPTSKVWDIAIAMHKKNPEVRRKEVLQACVDAGIAYNTARTQYQRWYRVTKYGIVD